MPTTDPSVWAALTADPLVAYPLAAAALLVVTALVQALLRGEAAWLARPGTWLGVALAAAAILGLTLIEARLPQDAPWAQLRGVRLLPLVLLALSRGALPALAAAAMVAPLEEAHAALPFGAWLAAVQGATLGWLRDAPGPARHRWAAPLHAGLAWLLTRLTAGVAAVAWAQPLLPPAEVAVDALWGAAGAALVVVLLFTPRAAWWRHWAPRVDPDRTAALLRPLAPAPPVRPGRLPAPPTSPPALRGSRGRREALEPPPEEPELR